MALTPLDCMRALTRFSRRCPRATAKPKSIPQNIPRNLQIPNKIDAANSMTHFFTSSIHSALETAVYNRFQVSCRADILREIKSASQWMAILQDGFDSQTRIRFALNIVETLTYVEFLTHNPKDQKDLRQLFAKLIQILAIEPQALYHINRLKLLRVIMKYPEVVFPIWLNIYKIHSGARPFYEDYKTAINFTGKQHKPDSNFVFASSSSGVLKAEKNETLFSVIKRLKKLGATGPYYLKVVDGCIHLLPHTRTDIKKGFKVHITVRADSSYNYTLFKDENNEWNVKRRGTFKQVIST